MIEDFCSRWDIDPDDPRAKMLDTFERMKREELDRNSENNETEG